jgi:hypothetical protein
MAAMTETEREDFYFALQPIDALEIADWLREHHPAVFDAAADRIRSTRAVLTTASRPTAQNGENS